MSKQDRQGARTTAGLEQKYNFGRVFSDQEKENARQNKEMNRQDLTMAQFISFAVSAIDRLSKDLSDANNRIAELQTVDNGLLERISGAEGSIKEHDKRLQTTEESISQHTTRLEATEVGIIKQNNRLTAAEGSISNHGKRLTAAESDISSLKERVTALETVST